MKPSSRCRAPRAFLATLVVFLFGGAALAATGSEPSPSHTPTVADLAWLAGHWRGTLKNGATFEAHYTDASGGTIVSVSKEHRDGRTLTFELELFFEQDGRVVYLPHPNGQRSEHSFPLVAFDATAPRAEFENTAHDFPQRFRFHRESPDVLAITLSGPGRNGKVREIRYELHRVR